MEHYFIAKSHSDDEYFKWNYNFNNHNYVFNTVSGVFSFRQVDRGSEALLNYIVKNNIIHGSVLDIGAGLGIIGIILKGEFNSGISVTLSDVNKTAIDLCKRNALENKVEIHKVVLSDVFDNINESYDNIVSNPPIKVGKEILFKFCDGGFSHLNQGGQLLFVVRKDLGAMSVKSRLNELFGNCEIMKRSKGYYVLKCIKK